MGDLSGKTVLITGGAMGIGEAIAELFASEGASIIVADVQDNEGRALASRLGPSHRYVSLNVASPEAWATVASELPPLDIVILNAAVTTRPRGAPQLDNSLNWMKPEHFRKVIDVNCGGVVHGMMACWPLMTGRDGATIMVTGSTASLRPFKEDPLYVLSKHGLVGLVGSVAPLFDSYGIRVMLVCPNSIRTTMTAPDIAEELERQGRFSTPQFMAQAFYEVYRKGKSGEVWQGGGQRPPSLFKTPGLTDVTVSLDVKLSED